MSMTQILKNIFSKKSATNHKVVTQTDFEPEERSAVLDFSSKTMSRIASVTLFFFLSQTFAQTLYAATDGLSGLRLHITKPINYVSFPEFSLSGTFSGEDDTASHDSNYLAESGSSFSSNQSQPNTPTQGSVPASPASSEAKIQVEKILCGSPVADVAIDEIKGQQQHGWGVSTHITPEKNGFKLKVGHQNNLLLSAFIGFSGLVQITHSALADTLSFSVKSYATVHFDKKNEGILGQISVDAKDMQVTGDWHADSLTAMTKRFSVKDKSAMTVHGQALVKSDVVVTKGATLKAEELTVESFEIDNENGTLGGIDSANITLKKRASSRFQNKGGKIGSAKKAVFNIEDGTAIRHLGCFQGEDVTIRHQSSEDVLDLTQGVIQASKNVWLDGKTIKGRSYHNIGIKFETPTLWIKAKDFNLLPQTSVKKTIVYLVGLQNFHLTHDYRTAQKFSVIEEAYFSKTSAAEALKKTRTQDREFHIDATVQAKSMEILTPNYTGVVGLEDGASSKRGELLVEDNHLDVVAHDFDLQKGLLCTLNKTAATFCT